MVNCVNHVQTCWERRIEEKGARGKGGERKERGGANLESIVDVSLRPVGGGDEKSTGEGDPGMKTARKEIESNHLSGVHSQFCGLDAGKILDKGEKTKTEWREKRRRRKGEKGQLS